jgi:hypothetical protein
MRAKTRGTPLEEARTPDPKLTRHRMLKDDRVRAEEERSIFNVKDAPDRLG